MSLGVKGLKILFNVCEQERQRVSSSHGSEKNNNSRSLNTKLYVSVVQKEVPGMESCIGENIH